MCRLVDQGIDEDLLARAFWFLSSCETVLLTAEESDRVFRMTRDISIAMKEKYGFRS